MGVKKSIALLSAGLVLFIGAGNSVTAPFFLPIFLVPLFYFYLRGPLTRVFLYSLALWSLGYGALHLWVINSFTQVFRISHLLAGLIFAVMAFLFYGIYTALFSAGAAILLKRALHHKDGLTGKGPGSMLLSIAMLTVGIPLLWYGIEFFRGIVLPAFNINTLTSFLYRYPSLLRIEPVVGESIFSALIVLVNIIFYLLLEAGIALIAQRRDRGHSAISIRGALPAAGTGILFLSILFLAAGGFTRGGDDFLPRIKKMSILTVQANIPAKKKWKKRFYREITDQYLFTTQDSLKKDTRLVLWPETALNFYPALKGPFPVLLREFARKNRITILTGGPEFVKRGTGYQYYNAVYKVSSSRIDSVYRKERLIPFAEYCPISLVRPLYKKIFGGTEFSPGSNARPIRVGDLRFGAAICFESTFPGLMARRSQGADILLVFSDDIWLGSPLGAQQHLATLVLRAIENRKWIVSSVNSGISAVISPQGRIIDSIPFMKQGVMYFPRGGEQ